MHSGRSYSYHLSQSQVDHLTRKPLDKQKVRQPFTKDPNNSYLLTASDRYPFISIFYDTFSIKNRQFSIWLVRFRIRWSALTQQTVVRAKPVKTVNHQDDCGPLLALRRRLSPFPRRSEEFLVSQRPHGRSRLVRIRMSGKPLSRNPKFRKTAAPTMVGKLSHVVSLNLGCFN